MTFKSAGAEFVLAFTSRAMVEYEAKFGTSFLAIAEKFTEDEGRGLTVTFLADLLLIGLKPKQSEITGDEVFDIVDDLGVIAVSEHLGEAMALAFPEGGEEAPEPEPQADGKAAKAGNGKKGQTA